MLTKGMSSSDKLDSDETISENPNSRKIWVSDALTELVKVSGRSRVVYQTTVKKMGPLINRGFLEENSDLSKEVSEVKASMSMQMEEVRFMLNQMDAGLSIHIPNSSQAPVDSELVGKPVNLFGPWQQQVVAVGTVRDINPQHKLGDRCMLGVGDGNAKTHPKDSLSTINLPSSYLFLSTLFACAARLNPLPPRPFSSFLLPLRF
ncbi:hypothetical protein FRX31_013012 [Thalictrum thalictroides]|uniref:Uncharacterized protein n=1 Tax=Thalictrum thalictroides TaxID=46969 RepID=A0A7J6WKG4_THATH|nr:hypothetical protein FRX31_013012 [Thalictrum thalictroides]